MARRRLETALQAGKAIGQGIAPALQSLLMIYIPFVCVLEQQFWKLL